MTNDATTSSFLPVAPAARMLGVPVAWLRREVEAGRVPHLRVGPRILLDEGQVLAELRRRAAESLDDQTAAVKDGGYSEPAMPA